ncbi:CRISPR-associated Csx2 family protein [Desulfobotulus alkaliphilus]|uniref:CRISPR-associated Csx2 family protein n=1 Tax=Desulfobotulus alkaliphilus TaxID=622671 RepID=A0A562QZ45_9BACT|nr:TIGR02221 family CRISPR-associated protein [Desulfobotulus alkaliphilus]TWI62072.1 CRISPR-associated Csx2 family protein [Desulfobotulus alkaliphilus]
MRKVFISFLGVGAYKEVLYQWKGREVAHSFVQYAELACMGQGYFDAVYIALTPKSKETHWDNLAAALASLGYTQPHLILLDDDFDPEKQWSWFEAILARIQHKDSLYVDMTHGFRAMPIVFSAALNFLQKARSVHLAHVWYGAFVPGNPKAAIVDMRDFYVINEWSDAVARLVEDADARKLAEVAAQTDDSRAGELNDPDLIQAFEDLTGVLRNVDIHQVRKKASKALGLVAEKYDTASETGRILLELVRDKFIGLVLKEPESGRYDADYFELQLQITRLLLEHRLYMQAFTVMRECIASVGLIRNPKASTLSKQGRRQREKAEVFVNMIQNDRDKWRFSGDHEEMKEKLLAFYEELDSLGIMAVLKSFCKELVHYRNGFDHAWTAKKEAFTDIAEKGDFFLAELGRVIGACLEHGILEKKQDA